MSVARAMPALRLLGGPQLVVGARVQTFGVDKRHQLLAYLACQREWVSRDRLADLFWSRTTTQLAKQNLRRLLGRVRELAWLRGLEVERQRVRWLVETDIARFDELMVAERWDEALALYAGPFLRGLDSYEENEFATWLTLEREHWHTRWRDVSLREAQRLVDQGRADRAADMLLEVLTQDELDEDALLAYLDVAAAAGQRLRALDAYRQFRRRLLHELGLEPTAATQQRVERLERHEPTVATAPGPRDAALRPSLPSPGTSFLGRELTIAEIASLLAKPSCQLVTLVGPGGVGKTRLAIEVASELAHRYPDGVHFVSAEPLASADALLEVVVQALGRPAGEGVAGSERLARAIGRKRLLLVLDGIEHLPDAVAPVLEVVTRCPNLDVIATSRERLQHPESWTMPVEGLAFPREPVTARDAEGYDAVALFVERAQRVDPAFVLSDQELDAVLEICRLVDGSPLAIELAAVWVRVMPCSDIVRELTADIDFLTRVGGGEGRQISLRAAFDRSWALLAAPEQSSLRRLGVFRGGFDKEAAAAVTGTNVALLAALVDKSLLRVSAAGRYQIHALVRQFAREKLSLDGAEEAAAQAAHCAYFRALGERAEGELKGADPEPWMRRLDDDYANLRSALDWAAERGDAEAGARLAGSLWRYWWLRGRYREGRGYLERALATPRTEARRSTRAKALGGLGVLAWAEGAYAEAETQVRASLALRRAAGDEGGVLDMLNNLGILAHEQGDLATARAHYEEVLEIDRRLGDDKGTATVLENLGSLALDEGDLAAAAARYEESLALSRALGDTRGVASRLIGLGAVETRRANPARALARYEEGVAIARGLGDTYRTGFGLRGLGRVALTRGELEAAAAAFEESLSLARETGDRRGAAYSLHGLGLVALERGRRGEGQAPLEEALALQRGLGDKQGIVATLESLARLALERDDDAQAGDHLDEALRLVAGEERSHDVVPLLEAAAELAVRRGGVELGLRLWGAAERWRAELGSELTSSARRRGDRALAEARSRITTEAREARSAGSALTLEQAVAEALSSSR